MIETEFTDRKGSLVALRSYWTGLAMPFYAGEADYAFFANVFSTAFAARLRAIRRKALSYCIASDANGLPRLSIPPEALTLLDTIDPGNTRRGALFAYAAVAMCGRELGDHELADAALRSMDQDCGRVVENGVASYTGGSSWANIWALDARITCRQVISGTHLCRGHRRRCSRGPYLVRPDPRGARRQSI